MAPESQGDASPLGSHYCELCRAATVFFLLGLAPEGMKCPCEKDDGKQFSASFWLNLHRQDSLERVRVLLKRARHVCSNLLRRELPTPAGSLTAHWCGRVWSIGFIMPSTTHLHQLRRSAACSIQQLLPQAAVKLQRCNYQKLMRFRMRAQKPNHTDLIFPQNPKSQIH